MLLIPCPWCGPREEREFDYGGNHVGLPGLGPDSDASMQSWHEVVHLRENPRGNIRELWYHRAGCERWITVTRNTLTHEFSCLSHFANDSATGDTDAD